jgi:predicted PurR-regulated permease PerM
MNADHTIGERRRDTSWQTSGALRVALVVLAAYAVVRLIWEAHTLILTAFLGVLFGLAVASGTDRLQRWRIPRGIGAPLIVLVFLGLLGGFGTWVGPTVRDQSRELRTKLPEALDKLEQWIDARGGGAIATVLGLEPDTLAAPSNTVAIVGIPGPQQPIVGQPPQPPLRLRDRLLQQLGGARQFFFPVLSSTLAVFAGTLLVIFLAIYVAVDPRTYRRGALYLVPEQSTARVERILTAVTITLRKWLVTQLIAMVVIGTITTIVLIALRVRAAVPLGILAGLLEFVPTIGPILSAVPAIAMGFVDSPEKALAVTVAYIGIQFLENHILIPILMKEGIDLPPALTIVTQALMALMFGFLGLLVAVPMLAAVVVTVKTARAAEQPAPAPAGPVLAPTTP